MKRIVLILIAFTLFSSCNNSKDPDICCAVIDTGIGIKYENQNGDNILNVEDGIDEQDVEVYYWINNEWRINFNANMDAPKGIISFDGPDGKYLKVFPSIEIDENNISRTKLGLANGSSDIIETEINTAHSNIVVTKVWYNDMLMWDAQNTDSERWFTIVK